MKIKTKSLLSLSKIILLSLTMFFVGCEKEKNEEVTSTGFSVKDITAKEIQANNILNRKLSAFNKNQNISSKDVYSFKYDFTVDTSIAKYVESNYDNYHSYTFPIKREVPNEYLENLLVSLQSDGTYRMFLLKYEQNLEESENKEVFEEGEKTTILTDNVVVEVIEDDNLTDTIFSRGCNMEIQCVVPCRYGICHTDEDCVAEGALYNVSVSCGGGGGSNDPNSGTTLGNPSDVNGGGSSSGNNGSTSVGGDITTPIQTPIKVGEVAINTLMFNLALNQEQLNWLADNLDVAIQVYNFGKDNDWTDRTKDFAELAVEALMEENEVDFEEQVINKLKGKAKCVYTKLEKSSLLKKMFQKFNGENAPVHLILKEGNLDPGTSGETEYGDIIEITLDINDMENTPSLWGAHTILHEAIHADIYRKIRTTSLLLYDTFTQTYSLPDGAEVHFPTLFNYYNTYPNNPQHNYMADYYRTAMEESLKEYANIIGKTYPDQLYKDIAWSGLHNTNAWENMYADPVFTENEQTRIIKVIKDFKESAKNECN